MVHPGTPSCPRWKGMGPQESCHRARALALQEAHRLQPQRAIFGWEEVEF